MTRSNAPMAIDSYRADPHALADDARKDRDRKDRNRKDGNREAP